MLQQLEYLKLKRVPKAKRTRQACILLAQLENPPMGHLPVAPAPDRTSTAWGIDLGWVSEAEGRWEKLTRYQRFVVYCIYTYGRTEARKVLQLSSEQFKSIIRVIRGRLA